MTALNSTVICVSSVIWNEIGMILSCCSHHTFLQKMITCYPEPSFLLRTSLFYLLQIKHDFIWRKGKIVDDLFFESQIVRTLKVVKKSDAFVLYVPKILKKNIKICFIFPRGKSFLVINSYKKPNFILYHKCICLNF